jgi:hypothetical protein
MEAAQARAGVLHDEAQAVVAQLVVITAGLPAQQQAAEAMQ